MTDEHLAFEKLKKEFSLGLFHCFVHLIRTIGSNSLLGFLLSDMLYTYSQEEWDHNYLKMFHIFYYLYNKKSQNCDKGRFDKVSKVLGQDIDGNPVPIDESYSQIYKRITYNVPTTTNHIEAFHMHMNEITKGSKTISLKLALICKHFFS